MAKMDVNPSEVIPPSMAPTLAEMFPPEALAELANPVSISMMKNGTIAGITATQPVFAGGQIVNGNRLAKIGEEAAYLQKQLSENEVEKTAEQYFWKIVSLQEKTKTLDAVEQLLGIKNVEPLIIGAER
jgi:basic membrane lipoprotein Med (substrate-binding protein (PBP1-ABC) superfamily)